MKAFALQAGQVTAETIDGRVLCHDIVAVGELGRVKLGKGRVLSARDVPALRTYGGELHLLQLESGDVHEDEASLRLARCVAGEGIELSGPVESQTVLRARYRGLFCVQPGVLEEINLLPDVSIFTLFDGQPVDMGKAVGAAKITPLAIPGHVLDEAVEIAERTAPLACVAPFLGGSVGVVVRESLTGPARTKFEEAIQMKIGWFGSPVAGIRYLPESVEAIAGAIEQFASEGVHLILAAGVNSTDPLDLTLQALERVGARTEQRGVPAHPGSTCWLAYVGAMPVFGLALCGMFSRTTVLDLLLPRILSGQPVGAAELASFGHGGMLGSEMAFRFPAYGKAE